MDLAWSLAAAAGDRLQGPARVDVYVALGAGDTATAIRDLTRLVAREQVEVNAEVVAAVKAWWAASNYGITAHVVKLKTRVELPAPLCEPPPPPPPVAAPPPKTAALSTTRKYLRPHRTR